MQVSFMSSWFYRVCEWVWRFAYVNLLWLFATLLGLIVFGIIPATAAMFAVIRKWFMKDPDVAIFSTFVSTYKKEFIRSNVLGLIYAGFGYMLYFNFLFLGTLDGLMHLILMIGLIIATILYGISVLFVLPVFVHYDLKLLQNIKVALIIGFVNPLALITLILSLGLVLYLFYLVPGLIPFFGTSMLGAAIMWCASMAFSRAERKQEKIINKEGLLA
ncbi:DUF624 domain-containing protein [Anaerobacillus alkaliphilus]|uniref:DUF624 domain-containing protein n=1 Tax=Anaerobacillus alkaliphilus TaxID=1548597 RepID=A0A4Q0VUM4_9BACI|nr:YesL family protein [Anaerobacillus alkaliphilus]RXJ02077.1 DUF624 domain-containing protein [Anaerobacillus alkaliphilus]